MMSIECQYCGSDVWIQDVSITRLLPPSYPPTYPEHGPLLEVRHHCHNCGKQYIGHLDMETMQDCTL
jgi:DNA-directed RNA polymerase subunit RPC12/RpoP